MSSSLQELKPWDFVTAIDSRLEFVEDLDGKRLCYGCTYKVQREGTIYILKAARKTNSISCLIFERDALKECSDVPCITHLVQDYGVIGDEYSAFLKEYADGYHFCLSRIPSLSRPSLELQLGDTVRALNEKGYFGLDLVAHNLIVSVDHRRITLIDAFYSSKFPPDDTDIKMVNALFSES